MTSHDFNGSAAGDCHPLLAKLWRWISWTTRLLLQCRVSLLSAFAGFFLFGYVDQAQDLFADISAGPLPYSLHAWARWLLFLISVFLVWAFPVHYAARRALKGDGWVVPWTMRGHASAAAAKSITTEFAFLIEWTPRVLGALPFVAIEIGLWRASVVVRATQPAWDAAQFAASAQAFTQIIALAILTLVFGVAFFVFATKRHRLLAHFTPVSKGWLTRNDYDNLVRLSLLLTTTMFFVALFFPFLPAVTAPRALIGPYLFGTPVLAAGWLARQGARCGFPLLEAVILTLLTLTSFNDDYNLLRTKAAQNPPPVQRQIDLSEAIGKWREANGCAASPSDCPAPLLVAIDGGASRAAFAAATALGYVFDHAPKDAPATRRLFALSGVSGGAFGAATIRTALVAGDGAAPPCKSAPASWFGAPGVSVPQGWRACLQALVAGDYLTPALVGLGFRDNFAVGFGARQLLKEDRAALVEIAWEYHYHDALEEKQPGLLGEVWRALLHKEYDDGFAAPFGYVKSAPGWTPLLMLNGTSVTQGARIIAADAISTVGTAAEAGRRALYPEARDLFEMLSTPCDPEKVQRFPADHGLAQTESCAAAHEGTRDLAVVRDGDDVRLSTTAMLSARFPVVSPPGLIRSRALPAAGDRVVDGGYFENSGLTSAMDLARVLQTQKLHPVVLYVQNNPARKAGAAVVGKGVDAFPPRAGATPHDRDAVPTGDALGVLVTRLTSVLSAPLDTLAATRDGHGAEAALAAMRELAAMNDGLDRANFYAFRVYETPDFAGGGDANCQPLRGKTIAMPKVSMSWWLSQAVQAEIDSQLCDADNLKNLGELITTLSK